MWSTNLVFSLHTEHSAQLTQAFTLFTLAFVRLNFASYFNSLLAKDCISQPQEKICSKNFVSWIGFSCLAWNNGKHSINYTKLQNFLKIQSPDSIGHNYNHVKSHLQRVYVAESMVTLYLKMSTPRNQLRNCKSSNFPFSANEPRKRKVTTWESAVPQTIVSPRLEISPAFLYAKKTAHLYFTFAVFFIP